MKAFGLSLVLFGLSACTWFSEPITLNERRPLDLMGISKLEVVGIAGNFSVLRGTTSGLSIQGVGRVAVTSERLGTTMRVTSTGDTNCYPCTVDIEIQVVQPLELQLKASNGNVTVTDAATSAKLESVNGAIRVVGATDVSAKTSNGEIFASNLRGSAILTSSNGKITLENTVLPASSQNSMLTKNGDLRVKNVTTSGGFVIRGNSSQPSFLLTGFVLQTGINSFTATRVGENSTTLMLETNNGSIQINP